MRVVVLTSARRGTASHHLPILAGSAQYQVVRVILAGSPTTPRGGLRKKLRKVMRIGPLGALMGYRMRAWYTTDVQALCPLEDIGVLCERHGIELITTPWVNHPDTVTAMKEAHADVALSLGNGYIASKVFTLPRLGMLNIHHELLPEYQNAQGVIWPIYNGSRVTGYTIHRIDKGIDTGAIVQREEVPIHFGPRLRDTVTRTMVAVLDASAAGCRAVLEDLPAKLATARPQGPGCKWTTPSFGQYLRILRNHRRLRAER
ncbi:MAG: hypothetical protein H6592_09520 [Flavobacteriales bacterium]|nr:hypothetical protein [Flavobacteriales bacterium]